MMHARQLILMTLLFVATTAVARKRTVLFIGNSYIYTNDIPGMIEQLATANGDTLVVDQHTPGGYTFQQHSTDANTIAKIQSKQWDIVVLQEQSQRPSFSPGQVASDTEPYAKKLDSIIRDNNACTETMFYMTWGRKNGDAANCPFYTPVCTYEGMQQRLRESYLKMTQDNNAVVAPVGAAWKLVRDSFTAVDLYSPDQSHPSFHGSYLAACVFYASIFHRSPHGNTFTSTLSASDAERLQYFAAKVTTDSLDQWQQHGNYVFADYSHTITGANTRMFQNSSLYATTYNWDFGDMNTSGQPSPSHTYAQNGIYDVTLTASNTCFSESKTDTVNIGGVGVQELQPVEDVVTVSYAGQGDVVFHIAEGLQQMDIYAADGRHIAELALTGSKQSVPYHFATGIYVYTLHNAAGQRYTGKLSVH